MADAVSAAGAVAAGVGSGASYPVWVPIVFTKPVFLWSFVFYVVIGLSFRQLVKLIWPARKRLHNEPSTPADELNFRKRDTVGRWMPSLIHAILATASATLAAYTSGVLVSNEDVIMHSLGYFMGDLVVDRDPGYIVHHVGPVIHAEVMCRLGAHFWHTMRAGWIMEAGNVVAHSAAVLTYRRGPTFHLINTISFWISRPASYYDGFMAWYSDIPASVRFTWLGLIPLISILGVYHSNTMWMIKMCKKRPPKKAAAPAVTAAVDAAATAGSTTTSAEEGEVLLKSAAPLPDPMPLSASIPTTTPLHVQRVGSRKGRPLRDKEA